ncbi:MAG: single-stranded DNA-binding protein [Myxococcales bacterium]|nr:single-stranded DNA-binding protein [Myxococcales bacterium]
MEAAARLRDRLAPHVRELPGIPVVLDPVDYAWDPHRKYLERYGGLGARALWLGMNPGPWGMAQTGVPFGAVNRVRGFLGITGEVRQPELVHPRRPIQGFACERVEVSGDRLWGTVEAVCKRPEVFFAEHLILNYCPLVWQAESGANLTPDKLPREVVGPVLEACDAHLVEVLQILRPSIVIGVGAWAERRARLACEPHLPGIRVARLLHPSPASPAANRGWAEAATETLRTLSHPLPPGW